MCLLEEYSDPENELTIEFIQSPNWRTYYYADVLEKNSNIPVVRVSFTLKNDQNIEIGNIEPNYDHPANNKIVHTSLGTQNNGIDMGFKAICWLKKEIKNFALSQGFDLKTISSTTRYTGARAKNNPGTDDLGMPKNFDVPLLLSQKRMYIIVQLMN